jgi:hypothetical protein
MEKEETVKDEVVANGRPAYRNSRILNCFRAVSPHLVRCPPQICQHLSFLRHSHNAYRGFVDEKMEGDTRKRTVHVVDFEIHFKTNAANALAWLCGAVHVSLQYIDSFKRSYS